MRPLEAVGFVLALPGVFALLGWVPRRAGVVFAAMSCVVLLLAAAWLGAYWQLIPLYVGVGLSLYQLKGTAPQPRRQVRMLAATAVICLLLLTAGFTFVLPMFRLPKPTGPYATGTRVEHLIDPVRMETHVAGPARRREIMVQIWYPATPAHQRLASYRRRRETTWLSSYMDVLRTHSHENAAVASHGAPFPVLLFNPAWAGHRTQNTYQVEDLASHGFIVVGIDHTYNSGPIAFPDGRVIQPTAHDISDFETTTVAQQIAFGSREVDIEAGDDALVLNSLSAENLDPRSPWFHRVDANDAGAFGHSFGGAVAAEVCYQDPRVKAALNEDGWMFGYVATRGLNKPYMVMNDDGAPITAAELTSKDTQTRRESRLTNLDIANLNHTMRTFGGYMVTIRGSRHFDFSDRPLYSPIRRLTESGTVSAARMHEIVEAYTLQFFAHTLQGKPAPLLAVNDSPYKEVQFENWFAHNASTH